MIACLDPPSLFFVCYVIVSDGVQTLRELWAVLGCFPLQCHFHGGSTVGWRCSHGVDYDYGYCYSRSQSPWCYRIVLYFGSERTNFVTAVPTLSGGPPASVWWSVRFGSVVKEPLLWCLARLVGFTDRDQFAGSCTSDFYCHCAERFSVSIQLRWLLFFSIRRLCLDRAHVLSRSTHVRKENKWLSSCLWTAHHQQLFLERGFLL